MSVVVKVYSPEVCETGEEMAYAKLNSVLDRCTYCDILIVLGDFNAGTLVASTECIGKCLRSQSAFASVEMLENIEKNPELLGTVTSTGLC